MNRFACLFLAGWALTIPARSLAQADEALWRDLLARCEKDQEARKVLLRVMEKVGETDPAKVKAMTELPEVKATREIDRANTAAMKDVIAKHGWPGEKLAGKDGSHAAWLLVQHADHDHAFQKQCLDLMVKAVAQNDASREDLAYLTDRVLVAEGKRQRYGTQLDQKDGKWVPKPLEDEANVDSRRAEVGLPSLSQYLKDVKTALGSRKK